MRYYSLNMKLERPEIYRDRKKTYEDDEFGFEELGISEEAAKVFYSKK